MRVDLPENWNQAVGQELEKPYFKRLADFVDAERCAATVFPPEDLVFNAMKVTPFERISVVLVGQDPYHDNHQAHGLCFSVPLGVRKPPSLKNILKELESDIGCPAPGHGCLISWATQGVLLLNTVLTVQSHRPNSHKGIGWETFTDAIIRAIGERQLPTVFVLWGAHAQKKAALIDSTRHAIVQSAHPSPLSARTGFFGSRPFSKINSALRDAGRSEITWAIK